MTWEEQQTLHLKQVFKLILSGFTSSFKNSFFRVSRWSLSRTKALGVKLGKNVYFLT